MRRGRWTWALALGLGLGLAALAQADEDEAKPAKTGSWFTRLFTRGSADKKKEDSAKKEESAGPAASSPALARQKAYWEWQRRTEVCYKLKQIAIETGDKELDRKADALDQRAWEVYVQRTGAKGNLAPDEQLLEDRLGIEAQRSKGPGIMGQTTAGPGVTVGTASAAGGRASAWRD
jgi:hypothetical protein